MHFDLQQVIQQHDLQQIEAPFTKEDIDNVVKNPLDKVLGPDGFNGIFIKKCWHIIKGIYINSVLTSLKKE
jgi:Holliday junction resolvase RusA-like endonuclease